MATTYTLQSKSYDGRYLELVCVQTKNNDSNTSTINWTLSAKGGSVNYYSTGPTTVIINGQTVYSKSRVAYSKKTFPAAKGSTTGSLVVSHSEDGKKTVDVSLSSAIYTSTVSTVSGSWALDDIQRGAYIISAENFTDESSPSLKFTSYSSTLTHSIGVYLSSNNAPLCNRVVLIAKGATKTETITLTQTEIDNILEKTKNQATTKVYYQIETSSLDGKTYKSNKVEKTLSIVPQNPRLDFSIIDTNPETVAATGRSTFIVKGKSNINYTISGLAYKKATIVEYGLIHDGKTYNTATGTISGCKSNIFEYWITDSRGFTSRVPYTHPGFVDYVEPSCNMKASIALSGETQAAITFELNGSYYAGYIGNNLNQLILEAHYQTDGGEWSNWIPLTATPYLSNGNYTLTDSIILPDYEASYTVECRAKDNLSTAYSQHDTKTLVPLFDWGKDDFQFNIPVKVKGNMNVSGIVEAAGFTVNGQEQITVEEEGESDGWYYRKWSNGVAECWMTLEHSTTITKTWGTMYVGNTLMDRQNYPFVFTSKPFELATLLNGSNAAWIFAESQGNGVNGAYASAIYNVCRPSSVSTSQTFYINIYVRGNWR